MMRTFIAIDIPAKCRELIRERMCAWRSYKADIRWVDPDNLHITMKFLGDVPKDRLEPVLSVCKALAGAGRRFSLFISDTGVFPCAANPRVLWVGIKGDTDALSSLQRAIDSALEQKGLARQEARPFLPHLTTGRVRSRRGIAEFIGGYLKDGIESASFIIDEIVVYRSELTGNGPLYHPLASYGLGPDASS